MDIGRVFGKNREIDAVAEPGGAERIGFSGPGFNRRHTSGSAYDRGRRPKLGGASG